MSKKHYVIWKGANTGVFDNWSQVKSLIDGRSDAQYMGFESKELAEAAFRESYTRALMQRSLQKSGGSAAQSSTSKASGSTAKKTAAKKTSASNSRNVIHQDINIYCDGACSPNPGKAGTGLAIYEKDKVVKLAYGLYDANGTNNSAELLGILEALKIANTYVGKNLSIQILSDSKYSIDCITKWATGWKNKGWTRGKNEEIKNLAIIQQSYELYQKIKSDITINHVKGHANIEGNELADRMAVLARSNKEMSIANYQGGIDVAAILAMTSG
ncbi:MAG: viroplasmin family protein [Psychrobium sp.]|nr:viroplasmin family protein [Psychrobium sp.]